MGRPRAVAEALVPGSGTVTIVENTSSVFSGASTDIIEDYCSDYDEKVVEIINEIGETYYAPNGSEHHRSDRNASKGGLYYIIEDGITERML